MDAVICAPALRSVCAYKALLQLSAFFSFQCDSVHSEQSIALYGEDGFSAELRPHCQIRLRAAFSLLTGAACSNDP